MGGRNVQYRGFKDLKVYQLAYSLAIEIHRESKKFPREELYSLTDQLRRASRSVVASIAEAWKKRRYQRAFVSKLSDGSTEAAEVDVWLDMARDFGYLPPDLHSHFTSKYDEVSRMLTSMMEHPERFCH